MTEIQTNPHYISNPKAERHKRIVAQPPAQLPSYNLCTNKDLDKRWRALNNDIYRDAKNEKNKSGKTFLKWFAGLVGVILGIKLLRKYF